MALILIDPRAIAVYWRILCCVETGRSDPTTPICDQPWHWVARSRNLAKWVLRNIHRHHSCSVSHKFYIPVVPRSASWCFCWIPPLLVFCFSVLIRHILLCVQWERWSGRFDPSWKQDGSSNRCAFYALLLNLRWVSQAILLLALLHWTSDLVWPRLFIIIINPYYLSCNNLVETKKGVMCHLVLHDKSWRSS